MANREKQPNDLKPMNMNGKPLDLDGSARTVAEVIEELKTLRQALLQSEERCQRMMHGSKTGLWDWNLEDNSVWYAPNFKEMLGYSGDEFPDCFESWASHLHPSDEEMVHTAMTSHLKSCEPYCIKYRLRTKSDAYLCFEAKGEILTDEASVPVCMKGSIRKISSSGNEKTASHDKEETQDSFGEEQEPSRSELETFLALIADGMAEPLKKITAHYQQIEQSSQGSLDKKIASHLNGALKEARAMSELMDIIVTYAQLGTPGADAPLTDLDTVLFVLLDDFADHIEEHNATVNYTKLPKLPVDLAHVRLIFRNLINNAIKLNEDGSPRVFIKAEQTGPAFKFSVSSDSGRMKPESDGRTLDILPRQQDTQSYLDAGLGLALTRRIVRHYGGEIWLERPQDGQGETILCFTLPA